MPTAGIRKIKVTEKVDRVLRNRWEINDAEGSQPCARGASLAYIEAKRASSQWQGIEKSHEGEGPKKDSFVLPLQVRMRVLSA